MLEPLYERLSNIPKLGPENVVILEKAFGTFYGCGLTLGFFLRHHGLLHHNEELQLVLVNCYTDLLKLVTGVTLYYSRKERSKQPPVTQL